MDWIISLLTNPFLITSVSSWFIAQVIKTIIYAILNKKLDLTWMYSDGGMPSGHSATISSLAMFSLLSYGPGSFQFAVTFILAIIICHDATGVRQETGKQTMLLKEFLRAFEELGKEDFPEIKLKRFVGHTPVQVLAGITVGILNALLMYFIIFGA